MKRLGRWLFNFAVVVSLLLCVAMAVLWVRSHYYHDFLYLGGMDRPNFTISSDASGRLMFVKGNTIKGTPSHERSQWISYKNQASDPDPSDSWLGFYTYYGSIPPRITLRAIRFPYWAPVLLLAILPCIWLVNRIQRRKLIPGRCARCGYDLRATPERCPECGTIPESTARMLEGTDSSNAGS